MKLDEKVWVDEIASVGAGSDSFYGSIIFIIGRVLAESPYIARWLRIS